MEPTPEELMLEVASAAKDPFHPTFDGIFLNQDPTLLDKGQGQGIELYRQCLQDGRTNSLLEKRAGNVIARPWKVVEASQSALDLRAAAIVREQLMALDGVTSDMDEQLIVPNPGLDGLSRALLKHGFLFGYQPGECMWERVDRQLRLAEVRIRNPRRFSFAAANGSAGGYVLRLLTDGQPLTGVPVPRRKFIVHSFGSLDGDPYGHGLGSVLWWLCWFDRQSMGWWLQFAEKYGEPTSIGEYPANATAVEKRRLLAAAKAINRRAAVVYPQGMTLKLLEAARGVVGDFYSQLKAAIAAEKAITVLGETLTTEVGDTGSYAASKTHENVGERQARGDADLLSATLNGTICKWITELNVPGATPPTVWRDFEESEDLDRLAQRDERLFRLGYRRTLASVIETYGGEWEDVRNAANAAPPEQLPPQAEMFAEEPDLADLYGERASEAAVEVMRGLVGPVRKAVMEARSLPELRRRLGELYPKLPTRDLAGLVERARTAAHLAGRFEVSDGR